MFVVQQILGIHGNKV